MNGRLPDPPAERLVYLSEDSQFTINAARSVAASSFVQPPRRGPSGPRNIYSAIEKSIRLEGFISTNNLDLWQDFQRDVGRWISEGKIKWQETVVTGLENAPAAFLDLFASKNIGKMLVRLSSA